VACAGRGLAPQGWSRTGSRSVGATRAAENGATEAELDSLFGWERGSGTSAIYTRDALRARLSKGAIGKLVSVKINTKQCLNLNESTGMRMDV
jgi:hypothetical protein